MKGWFTNMNNMPEMKIGIVAVSPVVLQFFLTRYSLKAFDSFIFLSKLNFMLARPTKVRYNNNNEVIL